MESLLCGIGKIEEIDSIVHSVERLVFNRSIVSFVKLAQLGLVDPRPRST